MNIWLMLAGAAMLAAGWLAGGSPSAVSWQQDLRGAPRLGRLPSTRSLLHPASLMPSTSGPGAYLRLTSGDGHRASGRGPDLQPVRGG